MNFVYPNQLSKEQLDTALQDDTVNIILPTFENLQGIENLKSFPCYAVYQHPSDFPDKFVCRLFDGEVPLRLITLADTLEGIRDTIPKQSLICILPSQNDDPVISEVWI